MKLDHATIMAHMCQMAKEAQLTKQAGLPGALLGAGIGGAALPVIDALRGRKHRMGSSALAGALSGAALGYSVPELATHGMDGLYDNATNFKINGHTPEEIENTIEAGRTPLQFYEDSALDPTRLGMTTGPAAAFAMSKAYPNAGLLRKGVVGVGAGLIGNAVSHGLESYQENHPTNLVGRSLYHLGYGKSND